MPNMMSFRFLFAPWIRFQTINNNFLSEVDNYSFKMTQFSTNNIMLQSCHPYMEHKGEKCISPVMHYPQIIIERREKIRRKWNKFWCPIYIYLFIKINLYPVYNIIIVHPKKYTKIFIKHAKVFMNTHACILPFFLVYKLFFDNKNDKHKYGLCWKMNAIPLGWINLD